MGWVDVVSVAGFACLLATLLLYSAAAMPFQRFMNLPDFVGILGYALRSGVLAGVAGALVVGLGFGRVLSHVVVRVFFMLTFVVGNASFCAMALGGAWPEWAFLPVGICVGAGCLGELLAWGRILARYNLRQATGVVAGSAVLAALVGWAQLHVSEASAVALFMLCVFVCAALPFAFAPFRDAWAKSDVPAIEVGVRGGQVDGAHDDRAQDRHNDQVQGERDDQADGVHDGQPRGERGDQVLGGHDNHVQGAHDDQAQGKHDDDRARSASASKPPASSERVCGATAVPGRLRGFLEMTFVPGVGLALFAMLMAVRGELFFENYSEYVVIQVVVALLLLACMLFPASTPLLRAVYRGLIPVLSVAMLVFNYFSESLLGGSPFELTFVLVLYTAAALLTLSTLVGMAHAAEYPTDLVVCVGVALFCFVTVFTQVGCANIGADPAQVRTLIVVTSGLYAAGMVVYALWRGLRADHEAFVGAGDLGYGRGAGLASPRAASILEDVPAPDASDVLLGEASIEARCDELARTYGLTAREREVLGFLAHGHNGVYIGEELVISPNTVRTHIHNIYRKLNVTSREDILRIVRE